MPPWPDTNPAPLMMSKSSANEEGRLFIPQNIPKPVVFGGQEHVFDGF